MHRTQILLEDEQYERLRDESARTGRSIGELVRLAIDRSLRRPDPEELRRAIQDSCGAADNDDFDGLTGEEYAERVRHGWSQRWTERGWDA